MRVRIRPWTQGSRGRCRHIAQGERVGENADCKRCRSRIPQEKQGLGSEACVRTPALRLISGRLSLDPLLLSVSASSSVDQEDSFLPRGVVMNIKQEDGVRRAFHTVHGPPVTPYSLLNTRQPYWNLSMPLLFQVPQAQSQLTHM